MTAFWYYHHSGSVGGVDVSPVVGGVVVSPVVGWTGVSLGASLVVAGASLGVSAGASLGAAVVAGS